MLTLAVVAACAVAATTAVSLDTVTVSATPAFAVHWVQNLTYAQGLTCASTKYDNCKPMDLLLDVYVPTNATGPRPALVIIHGGGNSGGSRLNNPPIQGSAEFYACRGWVVFNIDYRLSGDNGLVPKFPSSDLSWTPSWRSGYPAVRDAKAAIRFVRASATRFGVTIDTTRITVSGGSAGATNSITAGVVHEDDYKTELSLTEDPTLASTHLNYSSSVAAVVSHWASDGEIDLIQEFDPAHESRYSPSNAPIVEFHGNVAAYNKTGAPYVLHVLEGCAHAAWCWGCSTPCRCQTYCDKLDNAAFPQVVSWLNLTLV